MADYIVESPIKDFEALAATALENIETERATLAGSPTNAQVIAILDNILNRQKKEIKVLRKLLRQVNLK